MSHASEPWMVAEGQRTGHLGIVQVGKSAGVPLLQICEGTMRANLERIVGCVNGCAGLNPAAYREVVETLEATRKWLAQQGFIERSSLFLQVVNALAHAAQQPGKEQP